MAEEEATQPTKLHNRKCAIPGQFKYPRYVVLKTSCAQKARQTDVRPDVQGFRAQIWNAKKRLP